MGRYGNRAAADQMERDGIRTLPRWSKPRRGIGASIQVRIDNGRCGDAACALEARYSTPLGNRCFGHSIAQRTPRHKPIAVETE